jgi:hypothetical protein
MLKKAASGGLAPLSCSRTSLYASLAKVTAALSEETHVLACAGWAGETERLFEHSLHSFDGSGYLRRMLNLRK